MAKIFESPDGGNTVYVRETGSSERDLYYEKNREFAKDLFDRHLWAEICKTAKTHSALQAELDRVIMLYNLIKEHGN